MALANQPGPLSQRFIDFCQSLFAEICDAPYQYRALRLSWRKRSREIELTQTPPHARAFIPASAMLQEMHDKGPVAHFSLSWLMGILDKHSFGIIMLLLALVAATPGIGFVAGLLLVIPAFQMAAGYPAPSFPRWIADRTLPTKHLGAVVQRAIPVLRYLEKTVHPRWATVVGATKRVVGVAVLMLCARLILTPIPLSNVLPALVIALISLAYLEEDGLVLSIGLLAGFVIIAVDLWAVWEMSQGARRISRFW